MKNSFSIAAALGAGLALWAGWARRKSAMKACEWARSRPGTAFITGASSGIGAEFANQLAKQGYNLVLAARRGERLRELAAALRQEYGAAVETLVVDLSDPVEIESAAAVLASLPDLSLLVNNAGFGTGGQFNENPLEPEIKMIELHVRASVRLTHAALPGMIARRHGGIINVSSIAGFLPMPGTATYGSTKAYLTFFSRALNIELAKTGVRVQALCPGFTLSEFHDAARISRSSVPGFLWMKAEDVVRESLAGLRVGQVVVVPGRIYRLLTAVMQFPPAAPLAHQIQEARLKKMIQDARSPQ